LKSSKYRSLDLVAYTIREMIPVYIYTNFVHVFFLIFCSFFDFLHFAETFIFFPTNPHNYKS